MVIACPFPLRLRQLVTALQGQPDLRIVAAPSDLMSTFVAVEDRKPHVVMIDRTLAMKAEFEVMRGLFAVLDVRWLVFESGLGEPAKRPAMPGPTAGADLFELDATMSARAIVAQLRSVARVSRHTGRSRPAGEPDHSSRRDVPGVPILIGASTGGVEALIHVLSNFGPDCPPTLVVQHTGCGFGTSLADLLDRHCGASVRLADHRQCIPSGVVIIAAGTDAHLVMERCCPVEAALAGDAPRSGHRPSVDCLFLSAVRFAPNICAALLTGMGKDGAAGLLALKQAGAATIAQDKASSVVFGMPGAAVSLGAADRVLPIESIGPALLAESHARAQSNGRASA
nr:CheB methylesterase domain-containing protein [Thalassococcus arenae]